MDTAELLALLRGFLLPGGEDAARQVRAIRTRQRGEMRMSPDSRWIPFTAREEIQARRSAFRWDARYGRAMSVTDAYEEGHGRLVLKAAGLIPVRKMTGPEFDKGELQRYLASVIFCPPALVNNELLEWSPAGPLALRLRDRLARTGGSVKLVLNEEGQPVRCEADRPRLDGKWTVLTPWKADVTEFREWDGLLVTSRFEAAWQLGDDWLPYFRGEVTSAEILRDN